MSCPGKSMVDDHVVDYSGKDCTHHRYESHKISDRIKTYDIQIDLEQVVIDKNHETVY